MSPLDYCLFKIYQITLLSSGSLLPDLIRYGPSFILMNAFFALKDFNFLILFVITAAGVVPCGGPKISPCTHLQCRLYSTFDPLRS